MKPEYLEIGICGLSCRLCPSYHTEAKSRCLGCKSKDRIAVGCPFITCARKKGVEFCWDCGEHSACGKWAKHRATGKERDSFKCYQKLEEDIEFIIGNGVDAYVELQKTRELLLKEMIQDYNAGRSKSFYCIAATVLEIDELQNVLARARREAKDLDIKERAKLLRSILEEVAQQNNYCLKLRK